MHYNYSGLKDSEVSSYILHKIERAGGSRTIIEEAALSAIHSYAQGNPRLIDNLMNVMDELALSQVEDDLTEYALKYVRLDQFGREAVIRAEYNRCRNQDELAPAGKYFGRISVRRDVSEE